MRLNDFDQPAMIYTNRSRAVKNVATQVREDAVGDLEHDLKNPRSYDAIDHMMQTIAKKSGITGKQLHDRFVKRHGITPDQWIKKQTSTK